MFVVVDSYCSRAYLYHMQIISHVVFVACPWFAPSSAYGVVLQGVLVVALCSVVDKMD
jgi:hypothetical protein